MPDASAVCVLCFITLSYVAGKLSRGSPDVNGGVCCIGVTLVQLCCFYFTSCIFNGVVLYQPVGVLALSYHSILYYWGLKFSV